MDYSEVINIVVAAGSGSRFGGELPKQFCLLDGEPVLVHAVKRLTEALPGSHTAIVLHHDYMQYGASLCQEYGIDPSTVTLVRGGTSRWESVKNALTATQGIHQPDRGIITVHDGARPLIPATVIHAVIKACGHASGAIPAIPVTDSLRQLTGPDGESRAVNRSEFRAVQTPQAFRAGLLRKAYMLPYDDSFTDDASVMTAAGFTDITLVNGDPHNIKITLPQDLDIAALYLQDMK